jgi:hypothetical protein
MLGTHRIARSALPSRDDGKYLERFGQRWGTKPKHATARGAGFSIGKRPVTTISCIKILSSWLNEAKNSCVLRLLISSRRDGAASAAPAEGSPAHAQRRHPDRALVHRAGRAKPAPVLERPGSTPCSTPHREGAPRHLAVVDAVAERDRRVQAATDQTARARRWGPISPAATGFGATAVSLRSPTLLMSAYRARRSTALRCRPWAGPSCPPPSDRCCRRTPSRKRPAAA